MTSNDARNAARRTAVVFDVGGVLVDGSYEALAGKLFDDRHEVEHFLDVVLGSEFHRRRDLGESMSTLAPEYARRYPQYAQQIETFSTRFHENWIGEITGSVAILDDLRADGVPVYALSNWGDETFELARTHFPFLEHFDGVLISAQVGLVKPDPEIFRAFCDRFDLEPRDAVFIDDTEANVHAASSFGFDAIRFEDPIRLREELVARRLLLAA